MTWDLKPPPPLAQYKHSYRKHSDHNAKILSDMPRAVFANVAELKRARQELNVLNRRLRGVRADELMLEKSRLLSEFEAIRSKWFQLKKDYEFATDGDKQRIEQEATICKRNIASVRSDFARLDKLIKPHRALIQERDALESRISQHMSYLQDRAQAEIDAKDMVEEARRTAILIIKAWNRLGYCYRFTKKNRTITRHVRFERCIVTPDEIQFKIDVSRLGLMDGVVHTMPNGVSASDLVKPETLQELHAVTERQVVSPNTDGECGWENGVWLRVFRLRYPDGIVDRVSYSAVMARYPNEHHEKFPVPAGVKAGRQISWQYLSKHPHWSFTGQTGSGKTNAMKAMVASLIQFHSPNEVRYVLIDLKQGGDWNPFENTPHAIGTVMKEVSDVAKLMQQMVIVMKQRMKMIANVTSDIDKYNAMVAPEHKIPRILIVFDEYTAIHSQGKELADAIEKAGIIISTQARAAGIHMVIGNQQTYSDYMNKLIKTNVTITLAGRQITLGASMSAVGSKEATNIKKLPGRMICNDGGGIYQVQMPHLSDEEMFSVIASTSKYAPVPFELPQLETDEDDTQPIKPVFVLDETSVVDIALNHFDGALKAVRLWEYINNPHVSRTSVERLVQSMIAKGTIEHDGVTYQFKKRKGNFWGLSSLDNKFTSEDDSDIEENYGELTVN